MSEPTTIPVGTKIYPYSTPDGIIQLVPLEALETAIQERDRLAERVAVLQERNVDLEDQRDQARQQADAALMKRNELQREVTQLRQAVAELNQRLIERTQDMLAKQTELIQEARQAKREARDAQAELSARPQAAEIVSLKDALLQAQEAAKDLLAQRDKAQAELAALRQPILADDGRSLIDIYGDAFDVARVKRQLPMKECCDSGFKAVASVVLAQAVRRMKAVPVEELRSVYNPSRTISEGLETVRARLIAAAKGEGQQPIKGLEGLTKERCLRIAEVEGDSTIAAGRPDVCPHASPHVFCETCKADPCPLGIPKKGEEQAKEVPQAEAKAEPAHPALTQANNPLLSGGPAMLEARPSNVMLDLETLGTNPGCVILSIGAVLFGNGRLHDEFYSRISLASAEESGLTIEADTLQWWTMQPPEVFAEALAGTTPLITVLTEFQQWVTRHMLPKNWNIWSNGASFDAPVLKAAYKRIGMRTPWTHSQERCFRTLRALDPHEPKVEPVIKHHALEDAKAQALHAMRIAPWL